MFSYRAVSANALTGLFGMLHHSNLNGFDCSVRMYGNALIHRSRNAALATLRPDSDSVLFVDDDMLPEKDTLIRLAAHDLPVVSALCTTKAHPATIAAKVYDAPSDQFVPLAAIRPDKLVTGPFGVGAAFLLVNRPTIEALKEHYLTARDWLTENRRALDRLHVRAEQREKERARKETIRRAHWEREQFLRVFDYPVTDDELQLGEDICFSRRLLDLEIPVSIDAAVPVAHLGEYPYGVWDLEDRHADESH